MIIAILSACYRALDRNGHPVLHQQRLGQAPQTEFQIYPNWRARVGTLLQFRPDQPPFSFPIDETNGNIPRISTIGGSQLMESES
ncbi:MAG: hypothetical protein E5X37_19190 [Mesorhizobium sp.]|nr:MAG: hypothetical protein E5X37_19190 [Mesorhizobium sp.]